MTQRTRLVALVVTVLALAGCATGKDAVAVGGNFEFIAPGGKQIIYYDPPSSRGMIRTFSGESLLTPGKSIGIQDFPDRVVVLNIWGSWCSICRVEMADLQFVHTQMAQRGVSVLGVDIRDSRDAARDFMQGEAVTYDSIYDEPGRVLSALDGYPRNVVPSTIVLDRDHRVAAVYLTRVPLADLMALVQRLAVETDQSPR